MIVKDGIFKIIIRKSYSRSFLMNLFSGRNYFSTYFKKTFEKLSALFIQNTRVLA